MQIVVMRHGEAENRDGDRVLTEEGRAEAARQAQALLACNFTAAFASDKTRAQQTAQIVLSAQPNPPDLEINSDLRPNAEPDDFLSDLFAQLDRDSDECVLLVSHLPLVAYLCARLCGQPLDHDFVPASFVVLDYDKKSDLFVPRAG